MEIDHAEARRKMKAMQEAVEQARALMKAREDKALAAAEEAESDPSTDSDGQDSEPEGGAWVY